MATCNHDCLHCRYDDCISDDAETTTEKLEAQRRDRLLTRPEQVDRERARKGRKKAVRKKAEITPAKREQMRQKSAAYRAAHREELNARQRERYAQDPAYREKCKRNTANYWRNVRKWYLREKRRERDERNSIQGQG